MFRLRFWVLLALLAALTIGTGLLRASIHRAREARLNPPVQAVPHPALSKERPVPTPADRTEMRERRAAHRPLRRAPPGR